MKKKCLESSEEEKKERKLGKEDVPCETTNLVFHVKPVAKGRPIFGKGFTYTPKKTREAERDLKILMKAAWKKDLLTEPVRVELTFSMTKPKSVKNRMYPSVKPDLDNYIKGLLDSMVGTILLDDSIVVEILARKIYGDNYVRVDISKM